MLRSSAQRRSGFTLIEMLVVLTIMIVIASLAVQFLPNLDKNKGVPNAAGQLEGWVRVTKSQALRDGAPRGIRLIVDPSDGNVRSLQYIEQPEPLVFNGNGIRARFETPFPVVPAISPDGRPRTVVTIGNVLPGAVPPTWDGVLPGDYMELSEAPYGVYRIENVAGNRVILDPAKIVDGTYPSPLGNPLTLATGFRVIRQARPLVGEPLLQMHKDVFIDLTTSRFPSSDILFNSSGQVANAPYGQYYLVVQHVDRPIDRLIVVIYTRTGKVNAVSWNDSGPDPYSFAKDGSAPGL